MNKTIIEVPEGITKLSNWKEFGSLLPEGKIILNKKITGCGATTYFLDETNHTPVILCSHRSELLVCKANSPRHKGKVHLFKSPEDKTSEDLNDNLVRLTNYINSCKPSPFGDPGKTPKILVTTDSLGHVISKLNDLGELDKFTLVSDEMQCIFTDSVFKGGSVLNYVYNLEYVKNVIFLSATPYLENYLDKLDYFSHLPYVELKWPDSTVYEVTVNPYYIKNLYQAAKTKIELFKQNGYFEENGYYKATKAVFFINSVVDIIKLIKNCELNPADVNIVCSTSNDKTLQKLKKAKLTAGHAQLEGEEHKTYTFVTKCAYEGVDFYHLDAYTYIFSDPNIKNMSMDLSLDLIQILGRQRLDENPWKNIATVFYKTTEDRLKDVSREEFDEYVAQKNKNTYKAVEVINKETDSSTKSFFINKFDTEGHKNGYTDDYLSIITDPVTGEVRAEKNVLIEIAEQRAYDIKNELYDNKYQVLRNLCTSVNHVTQDKIKELNNYFNNNFDFPSRMCFYCTFRDKNPDLTLEITGSITVPVRYHQYYERYGTGLMKTVSYRESEFLKLEGSLKTKDIDSLRDDFLKVFSIGQSFTNKDLKQKVQDLYVSLGIQKTAKATDIQGYFETKAIKITVNGKRINGTELISLK